MSDRDAFFEQLHIDASVKRQPARRWVVAASLLTAVALAGLAWAWIGHSGAKAPEATPADAPGVAAPPATASVRPAGGFEASGYLVATRSAAVSPEVGGRIAEFGVEEGDFVRAGQVLARLTDRPARDQLAVRESELQSETAALAENEADLSSARAQLERSERLFRQQFVSEAALDGDRASVARYTAKAGYLASRVEVARRNLQAAQTTGSYYVVRAPISGVLSKKSAQPGEYISPTSYTSAALCTIIDRESIVAELNVSEVNLSRVRVGQTVQAVLNGYPDQAFAARVASIFPVADRQSGSVRVQVKFDHLDERMRPEMGVRATFSAP